MEFKKVLDMHVHTDNSFDGHHSTMYLCERAFMNGLRAVAFTDHIEVDLFYQNKFDRTARQSFFEIVKARSAFRGKLIVCAGIELGQPVYDPDTANLIIESLPYDFVLSGVHNLRGLEDFMFLDYEKEDPEEIFNLYLDEIMLLVQWNRFDSLAHLTYPLRYIQGDRKIMLDMKKFQRKIDEILKLLAENGKALEINTSGLRQNLGLTMPDEALIFRFKQLGGEFITLGSDAHYADHVGAGIPEGMELAKRCGFDFVTLYQKREPVPVPIE